MHAGSVAIGTFDCPSSYASFSDTGPIERQIVVFPRMSVWIRHEGSTRFLADPSVVTIYNRAQRYERFIASPYGDRSDWFAVSDELARSIVRAHDEPCADAAQPFRFQWAASSARLYLRQRTLLERARRRAVDGLELEEEVVDIVDEVIASASRVAQHSKSRCRPRSDRRQRDIVESARALLFDSVAENRSVNEIATAIGCSPYHLCRTFKRLTGGTLSTYRADLRIRLALEQLADGRYARSLSAVALDLGFSSHSHFVRAMRRHASVTPGVARHALGA